MPTKKVQTVPNVVRCSLCLLLLVLVGVPVPEHLGRDEAVEDCSTEECEEQDAVPGLLDCREHPGKGAPEEQEARDGGQLPRALVLKVRERLDQLQQTVTALKAIQSYWRTCKVTKQLSPAYWKICHTTTKIFENTPQNKVISLFYLLKDMLHNKT